MTPQVSHRKSVGLLTGLGRVRRDGLGRGEPLSLQVAVDASRLVRCARYRRHVCKRTRDGDVTGEST